MGYSFSLTNKELTQQNQEHIMHQLGRETESDTDPGWDYDKQATCNSKALGMDPLPEHIQHAKFGTYKPDDALRLADALEYNLITNEEIRSHDRADQLWALVDWIRYWAQGGFEVHSG